MPAERGAAAITADLPVALSAPADSVAAPEVADPKAARVAAAPPQIAPVMTAVTSTATAAPIVGDPVTPTPSPATRVVNATNGPQSQSNAVTAVDTGTAPAPTGVASTVTVKAVTTDKATTVDQPPLAAPASTANLTETEGTAAVATGTDSSQEPTVSPTAHAPRPTPATAAAKPVTAPVQTPGQGRRTQVDGADTG